MSENTTADPLTIAYVAIGANNAIEKFAAAGGTFDADRFEGELRFIQSVIFYSAMLDELAIDAEFEGIFVYEVADPFGERFGTMLIEGNPTAADARALALELIAECNGAPVSVAA